MIYTLYNASKPTITFFSLSKVLMYISANPSADGWYTLCDGRKQPKKLRLEDIKVKEINELESKYRRR